MTAAIYFTFGLYCKLWINTKNLEWIPLLCVSGIIFFGCMGILPMPYIITDEIYPKKVFVGD